MVRKPDHNKIRPLIVFPFNLALLILSRGGRVYKRVREDPGFSFMVFIINLRDPQFDNSSPIENLLGLRYRGRLYYPLRL